MSARAGPAAPPAAPSGTSRSLPRPGWRVLLGLLLVVVAVWLGRDSVSAGIAGLSHARPAWVVLAAVAEALSMAGLARQQRRLLQSTARPSSIGLRRAVATTYEGNAISVSLPIAGAGLSTAFTYRRYTEVGAPPGQVVTGLAVSGVLSLCAFVAVLSTAAAATGRTALLAGGLVGLVVSTVALGAGLLVLHADRLRLPAERLAVTVLALVQRRTHRPAGDPTALVQGAVTQLVSARMPKRDLGAAFCWATVNWAADIVCLGCALVAVGGALSWPALTLAWGAAAAAASLNLTPGSVGVLELAATAALISAGVAADTSLSAVLLYRLVSFWLVLVIGWALLLSSRRRSRRSRG